MGELQPERLLPPTNPADPAVIDEDRTLSWSDLERRARCLARALAGSDVGLGQVWGVLARNRVEWAEMILGNGRAGTRVVPLNWHLIATEIAALLDDSGCRLVVVEPELRELVDDAIASTGRPAGIAVVELGADYESWLEAAGHELLPQRDSGAPLMFTGERPASRRASPDPMPRVRSAPRSLHLPDGVRSSGCPTTGRR